MSGIISYPVGAPQLDDLLLGTEIKEDGNTTKNFQMNSVRVLFAENTPIQFTEVLVAVDENANQLVDNGQGLLITVGPAQVNVNNPVSLATSGILTFNEAGLYTINAVASFGTGANLTSPVTVLLAGFYNDVQDTPTYSALAQYAQVSNVQHYNITKTFDVGDTFDFRLGKNGEGDGGLFAFSGTNPFIPIPTFSLIVEKINLV